MGQSDKTYVVTIEQFLKHLSKHSVNFPAKDIAEKANLPRSIVYNALDGQNVTLKTLRALAKTLGCEVVIMVKPGASKLRP
jgi:predicted transcriptional regulator